MPLSDPAEPIFPFERNGLAARAARGFAVTVLAQGAKTLLTAISAIALSRLLRASDFGLLALITPVTSLLALLANTGLFQAIVQSEKITQRQVTTLFAVSVGLGACLTVIFVALAPFLALLFHQTKIEHVILFLSPTIAMSSLSSVPLAILNRTMKFGMIAVIETLSLFMSTAVSVTLAVSGFDYWSLVFGQISGAGVGLVLAWTLSPWRPSLSIRYAETRGMLAFGRNLTISNIALYLNTSADNMIIGYRLGDHALGLYDRAWKLSVMPLSQLLAPISRIALPSLSRLVDDEARYRRHFAIMLQAMLLISGPGLVAAAFSASIVVPTLLGERWRELSPVFQWVCIGGVASPLNAALFWLFTSQRRSKEQVHYTLFAIGINISSYIIGVFWGLRGLVLLSVLSVYSVQSPVLAFGACKAGPVDLRYFLRSIAMPAFAIFVSILTDFLFWNLIPSKSAFLIFGFFLQSYVCAFFAMVAMEDGRALIRHVRRMAEDSFARLPQPRIAR